MKLPSMREWHWPHLLLLAAWPPWTLLAIDAQWPATPVLLGWLIVNALLLGAAERWRPYRTDWHPTRAHLRRDGASWAMNLGADGAAAALVTGVALWFAGDSALPLPVQVVAGILVAEFGSYWLHRWSHADGWLWRVHLLHHRPEAMNTANALTAHPINAIYNHLARVLPLLAIGLKPEALLAVALFGVTQSLVVHANIAGGIGWLDYLVGSARLHRLHHSTDEREAGNFGTTVPLWDQVFGSYRRGAAPARVGVFSPSRYPGELELSALLCWPLAQAPRLCARWLPACCRPA